MKETREAEDRSDLAERGDAPGDAVASDLGSVSVSGRARLAVKAGDGRRRACADDAPGERARWFAVGVASMLKPWRRSRV